jgi:hypothetical protein
MGTTSPNPNRVSVIFAPDKLQVIQAAQATMTQELDPQLVLLNPADRQRLAKMGPRNSDFIARALSYARVLPEFVPACVSTDELQKDLDAIAVLRELQHPLEETRARVSDTLLQSGSEAYVAALAIYEALKAAARRGSPQAHAAAEDLAMRLGLGRAAGRTSPRTPGAPEPAPAPPPATPGV